MEVNRQLSFSSLPPGGPKILKCFIISLTYSQRDKSRTGRQKKLPVSMRALVWMEPLPVAPFPAGVAASGSSAGSVALGLPRIFPSETPHVFVWVGSPHGAVMRQKMKRVVKVPSVFNEGLVSNFHSSKWEMKGLCFSGDWRCTVTTERWKSAFQWCRQPPIHNNKKAPSAVHWPAGPVT